jgi:AraC-like DNA-binding protein
MLADPQFADSSITEIAFGVGFEDMSHFARVFKSRFGVAPSAWRGRGTLIGA